MVTFARVVGPDGRPRVGVVRGDAFVGLADFDSLGGTSTIADLLADWNANIRAVEAELAELTGDAIGQPLETLRLLPPVTPGQILQLAMNYRSHADEMGLGIPTRPFAFQGLPSALGGPNDPITLTPDSEQTDWELELAFVVKRDAYQVAVADAHSHIAGYLMINDITRRDVLHRAGLGRMDYLPAKNSPGYLPAGPFLVSADSIDVTDLSLRLAVNGQVRQQASTADMIFDPYTVLSSLSAGARLLAGDVVLTGTPAGTGHASGRYLREGDVIEAEIDGLGRQRNVCTLAAWASDASSSDKAPRP